MGNSSTWDPGWQWAAMKHLLVCTRDICDPCSSAVLNLGFKPGYQHHCCSWHALQCDQNFAYGSSWQIHYCTGCPGGPGGWHVCIIFPGPVSDPAIQRDVDDASRRRHALNDMSVPMLVSKGPLLSLLVCMGPHHLCSLSMALLGLSCILFRTELGFDIYFRYCADGWMCIPSPVVISWEPLRQSETHRSAAPEYAWPQLVVPSYVVNFIYIPGKLDFVSFITVQSHDVLK